MGSKAVAKREAHIFYKRIFIFFVFITFIFINLAQATELPILNKAKIRLSVKPGKTQYGEITIENPTLEARAMRLYLEDWQYAAGGEGSKEFFPYNSTSRSCASWITFSPAEFTLPSFGKQKISYAVKAPEGAKGGYYAVLFFESQLGKPDIATEAFSAGISLNIRVAALFYVEAEGTIKRQAELKKPVLKRKNNKEPLSIQMDFQNTGNVDMTCAGTYHIMDSDGVIYARGEFNNIYTFSGDTAKLVANWKEPIPKGNYDLVLTLNLGKALEEAGLGRGPIVIKESQVTVGPNGEIITVGELK